MDLTALSCHNKYMNNSTKALQKGSNPVIKKLTVLKNLRKLLATALPSRIRSVSESMEASAGGNLLKINAEQSDASVLYRQSQIKGQYQKLACCK